MRNHGIPPDNKLLGASMKSSEQLLIEQTIAFVEGSGLDIRWRLGSEGAELGLKECFDHNKYLIPLIKRMVEDAAEFAEEEHITGPIYIVNTEGPSRDDCDIAFAFPSNSALERKLNMTSKAKDILEYANELPLEDRESYLQQFRDAGWEGYF